MTLGTNRSPGGTRIRAWARRTADRAGAPSARRLRGTLVAGQENAPRFCSRARVIIPCVARCPAPWMWRPRRLPGGSGAPCGRMWGVVAAGSQRGWPRWARAGSGSCLRWGSCLARGRPALARWASQTSLGASQTEFLSSWNRRPTAMSVGSVWGSSTSCLRESGGGPHYETGVQRSGGSVRWAAGKDE